MATGSEDTRSGDGSKVPPSDDQTDGDPFTSQSENMRRSPRDEEYFLEEMSLNLRTTLRSDEADLAVSSLGWSRREIALCCLRAKRYDSRRAVQLYRTFTTWRSRRGAGALPADVELAATTSSAGITPSPRSASSTPANTGTPREIQQVELTPPRTTSDSSRSRDSRSRDDAESDTSEGFRSPAGSERGGSGSEYEEDIDEEDYGGYDDGYGESGGLDASVNRRLKKFLKAGLLRVPGVMDLRNRPVVILKLSVYNSSEWTFDDVSDVASYVIEKLLRAPGTAGECAQLNGLCIIYDWLDVGFTSVDTSLPKALHGVFSKKTPVRIGVIMMVNFSFIFGVLLSLLSSFLSEKLKNRILFIGETPKGFHKFISLIDVPQDFGGSHLYKYQDWLDEQRERDAVLRINAEAQMTLHSEPLPKPTPSRRVRPKRR